MATMLNDYFYSVVICEDTTSFPAADPIGGPLISDSIKFTQRFFKAKLPYSGFCHEDFNVASHGTRNIKICYIFYLVTLLREIL